MMIRSCQRHAESLGHQKAADNTPESNEAQRHWAVGLLVATVIAIAILSCGVLISSFVLKSSTDKDRSVGNYREHLGYEHKFIAQAIVDGRGFSDPFDYPSGPTAWMPPLPSLVIAAMLWLADGNLETVSGWYFFLQLVCVGIALLPALWLSWQRQAIWVGGALCAFACIAYCSAIFQLTHDHPLQMVFLVLLYLHLCMESSGRYGVGLSVAGGIVAGLAALTGPAIAFAWAVMVVLVLRGQVVRLGVAALLSILVVSPWVVRNRIVFDRWIPIKSNTAYEAFQSVALDDDGVLDMNTLGAAHPLKRQNVEGQEYASQGEAEYMSKKWSGLLEAVGDNPDKAIRGLFARVSAALVFYQPMSDHEYARPYQMAVKRVWKFLPLASLIILLWSRAPIPKYIVIAVAFYLLALAPFIIISYYERYAWPTLPLQLIIVTHTMCNLAGMRAPAKLSCPPMTTASN